MHSELAPSEADLAELEAETVLFPRSPGLTFQTALLEAQAGHVPNANRLIDRGLQHIDDGPGRARLVQLQTLLAAPAAAK